MPPGVTWDLRYPAASEDDLHRLRRDISALIQDPRVLSVTAEAPADDPFARDLHITLKPGFLRPQTPEIAYLDRTRARPPSAYERFETVLSDRPPEQPPVIPHDTPPERLIEQVQQVMTALRAGQSVSSVLPNVFDLVFLKKRLAPTESERRETSWARLLRSINEKD